MFSECGANILVILVLFSECGAKIVYITLNVEMWNNVLLYIVYIIKIRPAQRKKVKSRKFMIFSILSREI